MLFALRKCKLTKKYNRIRKKLDAWRKRRGLNRKGGAINIAVHIYQADNDDELLQMMLAMANLNEESENSHEEELQGVLHNTIEDEESTFSFLPNETSLNDILLVTPAVNKKGVMGETSITNNDKINIYSAKKIHNHDTKMKRTQEDHNLKLNFRTWIKYIFQKENQMGRN